MPNMTPNFALPYPASTDAPCDFAEQWCDFTQAIDAVFGTFQSAIDRTIPLIPMAIMQQTVSGSFVPFNPLRFDTVIVDTAGMTDIDVDQYNITITRPGRYTIGAFVSKPTAGAPLVPVLLSTFAALAQADLVDRGAGVQYFTNPYWAVQSFNAGDQIRLSFTVGTSAASFVVDASWLAVIWHSDSETP